MQRGLKVGRSRENFDRLVTTLYCVLGKPGSTALIVLNSRKEKERYIRNLLALLKETEIEFTFNRASSRISFKDGQALKFISIEEDADTLKGESLSYAVFAQD